MVPARNAPRTCPSAWPCRGHLRGVSSAGVPPLPASLLRVGLVWTVVFEREAAAGVDDDKKIIRGKKPSVQVG